MAKPVLMSDTELARVLRLCAVAPGHMSPTHAAIAMLSIVSLYPDADGIAFRAALALGFGRKDIAAEVHGWSRS